MRQMRSERILLRCFPQIGIGKGAKARPKSAALAPLSLLQRDNRAFVLSQLRNYFVAASYISAT
jgi:hypothetical protein